MTRLPAARVLAVSSQVIYGPVGNSAAVPAMQALGATVLALPTVLLSNHPGHGSPVRQAISAETMSAMLAHIESQGWLEGLAGVMTGYFIDADQVAVAAKAIAGLKRARPDVLYLCDPVLGDDASGLYVPDEVAQAIKSRLLPLADVIAPNRFELAWLAGASVTGPGTAVPAARGLAPLCLATSIPAGGDRIATMVVGSDSAWLAETRRRPQVPHGTGDLLSGLFLAHLLAGREGPDSLGRSLAAVEAVLEASDGSAALDLAAGLAGPLRRPNVRALEVSA